MSRKNVNRFKDIYDIYNQKPFVEASQELSSNGYYYLQQARKTVS